MQNSAITLRARASGPGLTLQIKLNDHTQFYKELTDHFEEISIPVDNSKESTQTIEIAMTGKLPDHTVLDSSGKILEDRLIEVQDVALDGIKLGELFFNRSIYSHDYNGSRTLSDNKFFGYMGCNGYVRFEFTTPIFMWLLENM